MPWARIVEPILCVSGIHRNVVASFERDGLVYARSRYTSWIILVRSRLEILPEVLLESLITTSEGYVAHVPRGLLLSIGMWERFRHFVGARSNSWRLRLIGH